MSWKREIFSGEILFRLGFPVWLGGANVPGWKESAAAGGDIATCYRWVAWNRYGKDGRKKAYRKRCCLGLENYHNQYEIMCAAFPSD